MLKQKQTEKEKAEAYDLLEKQKRIEKFGKIDKYVYYISNDKQLADTLCYNILEEKRWVRGLLPWEEKQQDREWREVEDDKLKAYVQSSEYGQALKIKVQAKDFQSAYNIIFDKKRFNPVEDFLKSLKWDNVRRLENVLHDVFFVEKDGYKEVVFALWMKAAVGRALYPGIKFDRMPILISPQGYGKDIFLSKLCPKKEWYSESFKIEKDTKSNVEQLRGKWIVNYSEMTDIGKRTIEEVKSFLSTQTLTARIAWGKHSRDFSRKDVIIGTSNKKEIIQDSTGARRFDPIDLTNKNMSPWDIAQNVNKLMTSDYVEQLWAEAMNNFQEDSRLYLDKTLEEKAATIQESLQIIDPWETIVNNRINTIKDEIYQSKEKAQKGTIVKARDNFFNIERDIFPQIFATEGREKESWKSFSSKDRIRIKNIIEKDQIFKKPDDIAAKVI